MKTYKKVPQVLQLRVLDGYFLSGRGVVEHNQHDGFIASVLAAMNRADHLDQRLTFAEGALCPIPADDSQVALPDDAVINHIVVVPACFGPHGEVQTHHTQFRRALRKIRQQGAVPTPGSTNQFSCFDSHSRILVLQ